MRPFQPLLIAIALFVAGLAGAYVMTGRLGTTETQGKALVGGPFSLIDSDGKRVSDNEFRGKLMLVFFGYTHCPDICPTELQTVAEVVDKLGRDADKVAPVFITVDPERDTPEVLSAYVKGFNSNIWGLTGDAKDIANVAKAYRVYYRKATPNKDGDYAVDHSAFIYLMDEQGNYLTHFTFNSTADAIISVIKKHIPGVKSA